jgi:hypothetical protein
VKTIRRLERLSNQLKDLHKRMLNWRAVGFSLAVGFSILASLKSVSPFISSLGATAAAVAWISFFAMVVIHRISVSRGERLKWRIALEKRIESLEKLESSAGQELKEEMLAELYSAEEIGSAKRLIRDLDIERFVGLFPFFLSTEGRGKFLRFLTLPVGSIDEIRRRQNAIQFWESHPVLRRKILRIATAMEQEIDAKELLRLIRLANAPENGNKWLYIVTAAQMAFYGLWVSGLMHGTKLWGAFGLGALGLSYFLAAREVDLLSAYPRAMSIGRSLRALKDISQVLQKVAGTPAAQVPAFQENHAPTQLLQEVERAAGALGIRQNPILALLMNFILPWDLYWTLRFDRARRSVESRLPEWLETLSEMEAFIVGAEWNRAHGRTLPAFVEAASGGLLDATQLAHPLLPADRRVANAIRVDELQRCHLVTGSNMSGKSTFLRAIGLNLLLAQAGLKVVATKFQVSLLRLESSMRPSDSLADGFSSFYSEVSDLVEILARSNGKEVVFYLVDEIFRGTNNRERRIGAESVIRAFSKTRAMGMVTTHDLDLAALEGQVNGLSNHHFRDDVIEGKMTFNYEYRGGPCPSTNAIKVMRAAGLHVIEA